MAVIRKAISSQGAADDLSRHVSQWIHDLEIPSLFRTCVTCSHLKHDSLCTKFNANPPASTIIKGCDQYLDNEEVPF